MLQGLAIVTILQFALSALEQTTVHILVASMPEVGVHARTCIPAKPAKLYHPLSGHTTIVSS